MTTTTEQELEALRELQAWCQKWGAVISEDQGMVKIVIKNTHYIFSMLSFNFVTCLYRRTDDRIML